MPKSHCRQFSHDITSQSRTSAHDTIQSWIEGLPSPGSNVDLLRRQGIGRIQPSKVRQRRPLTELSNNMAPKTPRHKGGKVKGGKGTDHQVSPEKLPTTKRVQGDSASHDETGGDSDIQETPTRQSLRHPFPSEVLPQPTASTNTRPDYGDRPQSPTKMAEMRNLLDPFETEVLTGLAVIDESHTLYAILPLLEDLMQFSRGIGVLDSSTESLRVTAPSEIYSPSAFDAKSKRDTFGKAPQIAEVYDIQACSVKCQKQQAHEPEWNCYVHAHLLSKAYFLSLHRKVVDIPNVTTARIHPRTLAPPRANGTYVKTKMVYFAIVLEPSTITSTGFRYLEPLDPKCVASYNQTTDHTIIDRPLAISIETKTHSGNLDEAVIQLSIWVSAQYQRLIKLAKSSGCKDETMPMPLLPMLIAYGATWVLYVASHNAGQTKLWQILQVGSSHEILGIYQIIATLQRLMAWAELDYRPWFENNMVPLTLEQRRALGLSK